jgi:hypothetical protein
MKQSIFLLACLFLTISVFAQEKEEKEYVYDLFRGTHVVNGQSAETQGAGELDFYIAHRFGALNSGFYEMFGLDNASMRMEFAYGITDWLGIGVGRSTIGKEYDSMIKARILRQSNVMPISLTLHSGLYINATAPNDNLPLEFQHRLAFSNQIMLARKFSDRFSVQIMPTHVHLNLVPTADDPNDIFSLGLAGKVQITKNVALTAEYYYTPDAFLLENVQRPLAIGIDINTGNHVFQIHFTNASGMQDKAILTNTTGSWGDGDIQFGFNMVRTFKLKGTRY